LPWNKGADPNLWSILENTPKGVTIHQLDYGLDSGKIVCQKEIFFKSDETLKSTYEMLNSAIVQLFKENWANIKNNNLKKYPQKGKGSYHKSSDKNEHMDLFIDGWDTRIKDLEGKALLV
jgi:methionyl-tRNA formyltransferase